MILTVASALTSLGFVTWILGSIFEYHGIASIGAVILVGVGAMVSNGGLEVKTGEIEMQSDNTTANVSIDHEEINNSTVATAETRAQNTSGTTIIRNKYEPVSTPTHLSLGVILMLLGGTMFLRSLNNLGGEVS